MKKSLYLLTISFLLISCGHHKDVRPAASGKHNVSVIGENEQSVARDALDQARHYCEQAKKNAVIIEEKITYIGRMPEKDYRNAKGLTKAVQVVGGGAFTFGGKKESNLGGIAGLSGAAADAYIGNGYRMKMIFSCK